MIPATQTRPSAFSDSPEDLIAKAAMAIEERGQTMTPAVALLLQNLAKALSKERGDRGATMQIVAASNIELGRVQAALAAASRRERITLFVFAVSVVMALSSVYEIVRSVRGCP